MGRRGCLSLVVACAVFLRAGSVGAWGGFVDRSVVLNTARFDFGTGGGSNENYYDGDFGDFDGDGRPDRGLISRYGLLWNTGDGVMVPASTQLRNNMPPNSSPSLTGYLFGDEVRIGNDGVQWADVDGDGDLDSLQGGNSEPFVLQENRGGRFAVRARMTGSALNIVNIDLERDGDVDLVAACWFPSGPQDFSVFVNDGAGNFRNEATTRGMDFAADRIVGVAAGDVDGDRDFDLILASQTNQELWVLRNDGTGRFARTRLRFPGTFREGGFNQGMNLGDIDGDGDLDFAGAMGDYVGSHPRVGHVVYVNDGAGNFTEDSAARFDVGPYAFIGRLIGGNGKLMDVDYDGDLDFFAFTDLAGPPLNFQLFVNDGAGRFTYTQRFVPPVAVRRAGTTGTGADADITDLDGDGSYDVWVGIAGGRVTTLVNSYRDPSGLPADLPRNLRVVGAASGGVTLSWEAPPFAATARHYNVYRSLSPRREERDRPLLHVVANTRFEDEGLSAPITARTTTAYLGDPDVVLDRGRVEFVDRSASPGVTYYYSVAHVGTENTRSRLTPEVRAVAPAAAGTDTQGPELDIVSPTSQWWSGFPRVVLAFADGGSGIDAASLRVSFDRAAGAVPAGSNLADRAWVRDDSALILEMDRGMALPSELVTMTASVADRAGNRTTRTVRFAVSVDSSTPPTASIEATPTGGRAPLAVAFRAVTSDPGGEVMRWQWYFGDGETADGVRPTHRYEREGAYQVRLVARDNEGGVASATTTVTVMPCMGECTPSDAGAGADAGAGTDADAGTDAVSGSDAGPSGEASARIDAGADAASDGEVGGVLRVPIRAVQGGCGCRVGDPAARRSGLAFGAAIAGLFVACRRRRS